MISAAQYIYHRIVELLIKMNWKLFVSKQSQPNLRYSVDIYLERAVRVSSVDDFSTQDTYLEQIYLLLHFIESRL
jgi:hypothetical protein